MVDDEAAIRHSRRRPAAVAAVVLVVLAVALAGFALSNHDRAKAPAAASPTPTPPSSPTPSSSPTGEACPAGQAPGRSAQKPDPSLPLLPADTIDITVCASDFDGKQAGQRVHLTGSAAADLARRINASDARTDAICTMDLGWAVVVVARSADGHTVTASGNLGGCGTISNGLTARHVRALLTSLIQPAATASPR